MTTFTPEQIEAAARAIRRRKFERTSRLSIFDPSVPPTEFELDDARAALATVALPAEPAQLRVPIRKVPRTPFQFDEEPADPPELISARERLEAAAIMATRGQDIADRWAADHPTEIILVHGEREAGLRELKEAAREFARAYERKGEGR